MCDNANLVTTPKLSPCPETDQRDKLSAPVFTLLQLERGQLHRYLEIEPGMHALGKGFSLRLLSKSRCCCR